MLSRHGVSYAGVLTTSSDNTSYDNFLIDYIKGRPYAAIPTSTTTAQAVSLAGSHQGTDDVATGLQPVQWRVSLYTPISMVLLFISGILVAVGHHLFYMRFDQEYVHSSDDGTSKYLTQTWIIRYGTAFAFVAKTLLAGSVVMAYKQLMWINLRHKANSISTIDAVFAATHDLLAFLSPSFFLKAKVPALMALVTWCLPIAALITPSTLIVGSIGELGEISKSHVPTLNFNDTSLYETMGFGDSTSPVLHRITLATAAGMQILPMKKVLTTNTSYNQEFDGPSLKCQTATGDRLQNISAVLNETKQQLLPLQIYASDANIKYLSFTRDEDGISANGTYNVTTFVSDCVVGNTFQICKASGSADDKPVLWAKLGEESITCAVHNTRFNVFIKAGESTQTITSVDFEWKERMINTVTKNTFNALASLLNGYFGMFTEGGTSGEKFLGKTMITDTALLELLQRSFPRLRATVPQEDWMAAENRTFLQMVEELSRNQTLSLFSSEKLWLPMEETNLAEVVYSSYKPVYEYRPYNLWLTYGIAITLSFVALLLGLHALWLNSVSHDNSFSSIVASTRNVFLDELTLGHSLGATPMSKEILRTRLRFGEMSEGIEKGRPRAGFGVEEAIQPLKKGQLIY